MKRKVKILALVLVLATALTAFVGCGKRLSGTYEGKSDDGTVVLLAFDGNEFTFTKGTTQLKGTFEVKKDGENYAITMTYDETVIDGKTTKLETPQDIYNGSMLRIGEDYITIGNGTQVRKYIQK